MSWLINCLLGLVDWKQLQFLFNLFILEVELWKFSPIEVDMNWLWLLCSITEFVSGLIDIHQGTWSSQNSLELDSDFFLNSWILFVYENFVEI